MSEPAVRALTASDGASARALAHDTYGGTRYLSRTIELLELALGGNDPECVGMVSVRDEVAVALLLHGPVAGAIAVEKLHLLLGSDVRSLGALIDAWREAVRCRLVVCELPEDRAHATSAEVLTARGFVREGSVSGFVDDHTALALFVARTASGT